MRRLQPRQHPRQYIRRQRRDDAEPQVAVQQVAMAGEVDKIAGGGEDVIGALRHVNANIGEHDLTRTPLHQHGADLALELAHLHRQRRLADRAVLRRPPEMPVAGERSQIT
jgi:hypothetical protein